MLKRLIISIALVASIAAQSAGAQSKKTKSAPAAAPQPTQRGYPLPMKPLR